VEEAVEEILALDHHAHNIRKESSAVPFEAAFTESWDEDVWKRDTPHGLFFRRSIRQLAALFHCSPTVEAVKEARAHLTLEELTRLCVTESRLCGLILDDGLSPEHILPWDWHAQFVSTTRLLRVEHLAETLFLKRLSFGEFVNQFRVALEESPPEVVGFKSIAAYRGGLAVGNFSRDAAEKQFPDWEGRMEASPLYSFLLHTALEVATERKLPVQFHTGFGDPDLALELSNPLLLRPLVERYSCPFVLLHAGYPYFRELGFLASVYQNVWTDFGLSVPFLSFRGMTQTVRGLLELAPLNKVLYSSDASLIPDLYYLGAKNGRRVLRKVLTELVEDGDLTEAEAVEAAHWILAENARKLYGL